MPILATEEERNLTWSELPGRVKGLTFLLIALVILMATALVLGIEPDGEGRFQTLIRGLLGQGDVKSEIWLWISRLSLVGIVACVIGIKREQSQLVRTMRERREVTGSFK